MPKSGAANRRRRRDAYNLFRDASLSNPNRSTYSSAAFRAVDKDNEPRTPTSHAFGLESLGHVVTGTSGILNRSLEEEEIEFQGEESSQGSAETIRRQALFEADEDEPEDSGPPAGEDPEDDKGDPADGEDPEGNTSGNNNDTGIMSTDVATLDEHIVKLLTVTKLAEINNNKSDSPLAISMCYNNLTHRKLSTRI